MMRYESPATTKDAVALLAKLHPLAVIPSALFFGALEAGAGAMQCTGLLAASWSWCWLISEPNTS